MAARTRRIGCGCLPLVAFFLIGSFVAFLLGGGEADRVAGSLIAVAAGVVLAGLIVALATRSRRQQDSEDQTSAAPAPPPRRSAQPATPSLERSEREVRSGVRRLTTEPESDEARALKQRLTEAVSDLADTVEEMPIREPGGRLSSEEMIARAKERIRRRAEDSDL